MINLKDKSILFIAPAFFGYEKSIRNRLQALGAKVDYFDERPSNSFWSKAFIRLNRTILSYYIKRYYKSISSQISDNNYDYIFVLNIEAMPHSFLETQKKRFPSAKFILYMWDSVMNKKNTLTYLPFFDAVFSFDEKDCNQLLKIKFRPLFFLNEYAEIADYNSFEYDISFVGTAHSDRYSLIRDIQAQITAKGLKAYWFLYLQSRKIFIWNKIHNSAYKKAQMNDFSYRSLSKEKILSVIKKSKIILDIQHPKQVGLTMRSIEMLGAKRKLITTNLSIKNYDFYSPNNILVIDRNNPLISDDFFRSEYMPVNKDIYYKYSLDGWLDDIFSAESF